MEQSEVSRKGKVFSISGLCAVALLIGIGYALLSASARGQSGDHQESGPASETGPGGQQLAATERAEEHLPIIELMRQVESAVDRAAGWVNRILGSVIFYPVFERHASVIKTVERVDVELVAELVRALADQGHNVEDADLVLSVPAELLQERERAKLAEECRRRFCKGYFRQFSV
ncbi:MAG TPA: hypothetical protein EYP14_02985 [Planctomycetaceae bacterium]|nr:hypothetical protein [Planctomycetaceae bacterium]